MSPRNIGCLTATGIDCCCLANNHVQDWGYAGLVETLDSLDRAGIARAGAGVNAAEAAAPAVIEVLGIGRVLVFSMGCTTGGIPPTWGATTDRPGLNLLDELSDETNRQVGGQIRQAK
jgi:poly-gamma-glutamate capsule biosynthesis protein CapA/YwtB (metallophosphatase superfamily)